MLCIGILTRLHARTKWRSKLKPSESYWWIWNTSMKESREDMCYGKELVKFDCPFLWLLVFLWGCSHKLVKCWEEEALAHHLWGFFTLPCQDSMVSHNQKTIFDSVETQAKPWAYWIFVTNVKTEKRVLWSCPWIFLKFLVHNSNSEDNLEGCKSENLHDEAEVKPGAKTWGFSDVQLLSVFENRGGQLHIFDLWKSKV